MKELSDYANLKSFWKLVDSQAAEAAGTVKELFTKALETPLSQEEAVLALDMLFVDSHARIKKDRPQLLSILPLKQYTKNKLKLVEDMWWTDHFTGGRSSYSTLNTFAQRDVSTHFVQDFHGYPLYVVPLMHGSWHEPRRNADSFSIEVVNPGALTQKDGVWHAWFGPLPLDLVQALPPVRLPKPYRGASALLPFTKEQIVNSILLKRIVNAAFPGRLIRERMSQHSDWRESKMDMGPLWPIADITAATFENDPILEYAFVQQYESGLDTDEKAISTSPDNDPEGHPDLVPDPKDPYYIEWGIADIQRYLVTKRHMSLVVDGKMGPKTAAAVRDYQIWWNKQHPNDTLKVDGIPGPKTVRAMQAEN